MSTLVRLVSRFLKVQRAVLDISKRFVRRGHDVYQIKTFELLRSGFDLAVLTCCVLQISRFCVNLTRQSQITRIKYTSIFTYRPSHIFPLFPNRCRLYIVAAFIFFYNINCLIKNVPYLNVTSEIPLYVPTLIVVSPRSQTADPLFFIPKRSIHGNIRPFGIISQWIIISTLKFHFPSISAVAA